MFEKAHFNAIPERAIYMKLAKGLGLGSDLTHVYLIIESETLQLWCMAMILPR